MSVRLSVLVVEVRSRLDWGAGEGDSSPRISRKGPKAPRPSVEFLLLMLHSVYRLRLQQVKEVILYCVSGLGQAGAVFCHWVT